MTRVLVVAVCLVLPSTGCMMNTYSSEPNRRIVELVNQSEELRQIELEVERFWKDHQPSHCTPITEHDLRAQVEEAVKARSASSNPYIGAFNPTRVISGLTPDESVKLTVANVHKEPVTVFAVVDGQLRFLHQVPAGEAVDLIPPPCGRLAATFSAAPHCANYTVKATAGEVWLLRPAPETRPTTCGPTRTH
jgi:hypothetical protein